MLSANVSANQLLSESQFREECGSTLCLLAFLPDILDSGVDGRLNYLKILNDVARASVTVPVKFLWLQGRASFT